MTAAKHLTVSVSTAALMLEVSKQTIARWIKTGKLPAIKIGGRLMIRVSDIEALLDAHPKVCP
jgi:excisionase family DNA binding protein